MDVDVFCLFYIDSLVTVNEVYLAFDAVKAYFTFQFILENCFESGTLEIAL